MCGLLTAIWALTQGSFDDVSRIVNDPKLAIDLDFWPVWPILCWGALVVFHFGAMLSVGLFGGRARRRRRRMARHAAVAATELTRRARDAHERRHQSRQEGERPPGPTRRWVTVMFTDVAESTRLNEALGDDEWSRLLSRHRDFVRNAFAARGGEVVGTQGDGFLGRFSTPAEAVLCAVDIQRELDGVRRAADLPIQVRIGIHAGEAVEEDGDLVGRVVNLAARVTGEAGPGEILVTEPVADYLGGRLGFEDRGLRPLRGVAQPRHLLAVRWGDETAPDEE